LSIFSLSDSH